MSINWNKPLYDEEGREYFLVRYPDGSEVRAVSEDQRWVFGNGWCFRCLPSGELRGGASAGRMLSNSSKPNYRTQLTDVYQLTDKNIDIFFGKRDGEWFAEVVPK